MGDEEELDRPRVEYQRYTRRQLAEIPYPQMLTAWVEHYRGHPEDFEANIERLHRAYRKMKGRLWATTAQHYGRLIGLHHRASQIARRGL